MTETSSAAISGIIETMVQAYHSQAWTVLVGVVLMFIVMAARKFVVPELAAAHARWVALGLATVTSVGMGLQSGQDWLTIASTALVTGLTAIGSWETMGKALKRK